MDFEEEFQMYIAIQSCFYIFIHSDLLQLNSFGTRNKSVWNKNNSYLCFYIEYNGVSVRTGTLK